MTGKKLKYRMFSQNLLMEQVYIMKQSTPFQFVYRKNIFLCIRKIKLEGHDNVDMFLLYSTISNDSC